MSYFDGPETGYGWAAGHFLANDENCLRQSYTIPADHDQAETRDNGRKVVPAGAVIPANDETAIGILYEDIDVTEGAKAGSIVTKGVIYADRLPEELDADAVTALAEITIIEAAPTVTRPY